MTETRRTVPGVYTGKEFSTGEANITSRATGMIMVINSSQAFDIIDGWVQWLGRQDESAFKFSDETYIQRHPAVSRAMFSLGWVPTTSHCDRAVTNRRSCLIGEKEPNEHHIWGGRMLAVLTFCIFYHSIVPNLSSIRILTFFDFHCPVSRQSITNACALPLAGVSAVLTCNINRGISPAFFISWMILLDRMRKWSKLGQVTVLTDM
jgi:hypothetical protein